MPVTPETATTGFAAGPPAQIPPWVGDYPLALFHCTHLPSQEVWDYVRMSLDRVPPECRYALWYMREMVYLTDQPVTNFPVFNHLIGTDDGYWDRLPGLSAPSVIRHDKVPNQDTANIVIHETFHGVDAACGLPSRSKSFTELWKAYKDPLVPDVSYWYFAHFWAPQDPAECWAEMWARLLAPGWAPIVHPELADWCRRFAGVVPGGWTLPADVLGAN